MPLQKPGKRIVKQLAAPEEPTETALTFHMPMSWQAVAPATIARFLSACQGQIKISVLGSENFGLRVVAHFNSDGGHLRLDLPVARRPTPVMDSDTALTDTVARVVKDLLLNIVNTPGITITGHTIPTSVPAPDYAQTAPTTFPIPPGPLKPIDPSVFGGCTYDPASQTVTFPDGSKKVVSLTDKLHHGVKQFRLLATTPGEIALWDPVTNAFASPITLMPHTANPINLPRTSMTNRLPITLNSGDSLTISSSNFTLTTDPWLADAWAEHVRNKPERPEGRATQGPGA